MPAGAATAQAKPAAGKAVGARVVSTWDFGVGANQAAWQELQAGGSALDAVEAGARWAEADLCNQTVGRCGNPDRDGVLTLDACIMAGDGRCGSVAALEDIDHPVSVARAVMEKSDNVLLAGEGADAFAEEQGFAPVPPAYFATDMRRRALDEIRRLAQTTLENMGRVDALVNNAAIFPRTPFLEMTEEEWDRTLATNLKAPTLLAQAVAPHEVAEEGSEVAGLQHGGSLVPRSAHELHLQLQHCGDKPRHYQTFSR